MQRHITTLKERTKPWRMLAAIGSFLTVWAALWRNDLDMIMLCAAVAAIGFGAWLYETIKAKGEKYDA